MSILTGPATNIYADTTIPGTSAVAMTEFQAKGNSLILILTTTTGGCVSLTFTAETKAYIDGTESEYADVIDRDSVWSMVCTTPHTAGVYAIPMEELDLVQKSYYRLSYTANTAAGKLKVDALNWENPKGGGAKVSVGDVVIDVDTIKVSMDVIDDWDATQGSAVGSDGCQGMLESKTIDGTALPNAVTEGEAVRAAGTLYGGTISTITNLTGQYALATMDDQSRAGYVQITDGSNEVDVIATILSLKTDTSSVAGTVTDTNSGNKSAGSQRVVIATDDINMAAINASLTSVIGTDGSGGPADTVSVAGTESGGNIQELRVDSDGHPQVDVLTLPGGLTGFAEDVAHTTGDVGLEVLAVRNDTLAALCDTDGDYSALQVDASGSLYTRDSLGNALLTTIDSDTGNIKTAVEKLDNIVYVEDTAHTTADPGAQILVVRNDTLAALCDTDGDYVPLQVDASGSLYTRDSLGNALLGTIDTDTGNIATSTATSAGAVHVEDTAHTTADPGVQVLVVRNDTLATLCDTDGDYAPLQVDADGALFTDIAKQSLTAVKVSATAAANTATNPLFSELTDGAAVISTTNPLSVNLTDGTSACLISDANTGRATGNHVLSVQEIGADGTVPPTGSLLTNAPFMKITDGTTNVAVIAGTTALKTDISSVTGTATDVNSGNKSAGSQRVVIATDDINQSAIKTAVEALVSYGGLGTTSYMAATDANFVVGDSPATVDVNTGLGENGNRGWLANDGAGDFTLSISKVGTPTWGSEITLKNGETFSFDGLDVDQFRITHVADSAYRYFIQ